jgi:drug/metabolite transporter (DMT)-like permease
VNRSSGGAGLSLALVSAAAFGTSGSLAGSLLAAGWTPLAAVTVRVAVAAVVLTVPALLALRGHLHRQRRGAGTTLVYGVAAVAGAQLCYFNAVEHLSVAVALLLEYSGTLLVVGWLWLRHGHRPRRLTVLGAAVAVAGLALVLDLLGHASLDPVGVLWGIGAAVGLATYFVLSAGTDDPLPPLVVAWGGLAVGAVVLGAAAILGALPVRAPRTDVVLVGTEVAWIVPVLGLALVAAVVAYLAGIAGARLLGAKVASFVGLTEVLFAVLFAWILLGQVLTVPQLGGALLVVAGIALVQLDELRSATAVERAAAGSPPALLPENVALSGRAGAGEVT